ncbi:uncharacterized protein LOC135684100 [Rhopilema esculentum]|uniref:uncharacterized protein LOC135684100 n=1 Tax=Rhopilema esculentum TaxID=499914 RepID=UPI0031DB2FBE
METENIFKQKKGELCEGEEGVEQETDKMDTEQSFRSVVEEMDEVESGESSAGEEKEVEKDKKRKRKEQQVEVVVGGRKKMLPYQKKFGAMKRQISKTFKIKRKSPFTMVNGDRERLKEIRPGMTIIIQFLERPKKAQKSPEKGSKYIFLAGSRPVFHR